MVKLLNLLCDSGTSHEAIFLVILFKRSRIGVLLLLLCLVGCVTVRLCLITGRQARLLGLVAIRFNGNV